jgi:hypothetical protein
MAIPSGRNQRIQKWCYWQNTRLSLLKELEEKLLMVSKIFDAIWFMMSNGRHKSCVVAGGHLRDPNTENIYSGVISLQGIRLGTFLGELNKHTLWRAVTGNAYLESRTKEQVYIIRGPDFGTLEGHTLLID